MSGRIGTVWCAAVLACAMGSIGCTSSMKPGKMQWVRTDSDMPRVGNAYLLRGFIGVFSTGIDNLTEQINGQGVRAHVFQDDQWSQLARRLREEYAREPVHEPLILVGHSYGADDALRTARELNKDHIPVDLVVTLDPVTPPEVPPNVKRCVNIYQSNGLWDTMPFLRGVPVKEQSPQTILANYNIRTDRTDLLEPGTDHFNIEKKQKVHEEVVRQVLATCPPRAQWVAAHQKPTVAPIQPAPASPTQKNGMNAVGAANRTITSSSVQPTAAPAQRADSRSSSSSSSWGE